MKRPAQWKLLVFVPILIGLGAGVTYWVQWSKLRAEWVSWIPERPAEMVSPPVELLALEARIGAGEQAAVGELATWYRQNEYFGSAAVAFETLTELEPDQGLWWLATAEMNGRLGDTAVAKVRLRRAREVGLPDGPAYARAGRLSEALGEQIEAKDDYREAVERDPSLLPVWMRLIVMARAIGDDRAARQAFDAALEANPGAPALLLDRGRRFRERGNWRQALQDFEAVRNSHPELPEPWYASAQAMFELDRYDEGRSLLEDRLAHDPQDTTAIMLLCVEAIAKQDRAETMIWLARLAGTAGLPRREWVRLRAAFQQAFGEPLPEL